MVACTFASIFLLPRQPHSKGFFDVLCIVVNNRYGHYKKMREEIDKYEGGLEAFSRGYEKFGFTRRYYF